MHVKNGREETDRHHSIYNRGEVNVAVALYDSLIASLDKSAALPTIGIITTYRAQCVRLWVYLALTRNRLRFMKNEFKNRFGQDILTTIDFNTV
jgi:senataxin